MFPLEGVGILEEMPTLFVFMQASDNYSLLGKRREYILTGAYFQSRKYPKISTIFS